MTQYTDPYDVPPVCRKRSNKPAVLLMASTALLLFAALRYDQRSADADTPKASPRPVSARGDLTSDEQHTIDLFERCSPSVVYVSPMVRTVRRTLFGYVEGGMVEGGTGSGFVWDEDGHIVTNFHVINNAAGVKVTLSDNTQYEAEIVGVWPDNDVAVLKIDAPKGKLRPIDVGSSSDLRVGQRVYAIGNPYGLDFTFTTGVVSALNREIRAITGDSILGVIQTDAAINPGNSGGPLLDSAGRLVGINTAIFSQSGSSAGIGFAVPVDTVNTVVSQLIAFGKVVRPGLGVNIGSDVITQRLNLDGVLIISVQAGSGAELAGLQPTMEGRDGSIVLGDVIVAVDGTKTRTNRDLTTAFENYHVGDTVEITIDRNGKRLKVPVTLQAIEERPRVLHRDR